MRETICTFTQEEKTFARCSKPPVHTPIEAPQKARFYGIDPYSTRMPSTNTEMRFYR